MDIMSWLNLPQSVIQNVIDGEYKIQESDLQNLTSETLKDSFLDKDLQLERIKSLLHNHFHEDAYNILVKLIENKKKINKYTCGICLNEANDNTICCKGCLL